MKYFEMQQLLMQELRLYHYPIAVKFFFEQTELEAFQNTAEEIRTPVKPTTFCQWEIAARMKGQVVYGDVNNLGCGNAKYCFGWKELDEAEIRSHAKYTQDPAQAERFVRTKARLNKEGPIRESPLQTAHESTLRGIALAPLAKAHVFNGPDTVHFYCDNMQAYHLAVDYMAATDTHPLRTNITMNSSACGGNVWSFLHQEFNLLPACSGNYNAGKTERGEINVIIPGSKIAALCRRLRERMDTLGSSALTTPGDGFPGADICKNCPLIIFKKK